MPRRIVSKTEKRLVAIKAKMLHELVAEFTLEASQTAFECSPYCSTKGSMLVVTMRWARLKLESISEAHGQYQQTLRHPDARLGPYWSIPCSVSVIDCSSFSNSSVRVSCLDIEEPGRDILSWLRRASSFGLDRMVLFQKSSRVVVRSGTRCGVPMLEFESLHGDKTGRGTP